MSDTATATNPDGKTLGQSAMATISTIPPSHYTISNVIALDRICFFPISEKKFLHKIIERKENVKKTNMTQKKNYLAGST